MKGLGVALLVLVLAQALMAAPLFPDVPEGHWARDAVAALAARGLVEGYPGGTFKGDRAASRWEMALVVARLLARMEQAQAGFASRADLEQVRALAQVLRPELDALGVRVSTLEEGLARLDRRVTELERLTFYGLLETRVLAASFANRGQAASNPWSPILDYQQLVGSTAGTGGPLPLPSGAAGQQFNPYLFGALTVTDWKTGRILSSGAGLTSRATLGVRLALAPQEGLTAGVEFAAYTAQSVAGDGSLEGYYGVTPPYLSSPFTATAGDSHQPYTRMTLDHFYLHHSDSRTRLVLGALPQTRFSPLVYVQQLNPAGYGPRFLNGFGAQVSGDHVSLDEEDSAWLNYEAMATRLADGNSGVAGQGYFSHAEGASLALVFDEERGEARLNFLHAANGDDGLAGAVGLVAANPFGWVNPPGFYSNQVGAKARPITLPALGNDGVTGIPGTSNLGNLGPQELLSYGLAVRYTFDHPMQPRLLAEWAHSDYRPQTSSVYQTSGNVYRLGAGASFSVGGKVEEPDPETFEDWLHLSLDAEYVAVDPRYDPFILQSPGLGGILFCYYRMPDFNYPGNLYSLHDTQLYPHNREGVRLKLEWEFLPRGKLVARYGRLNQRQTSLQDVRFSTGALGPGTPNTPVLGYSPGFVDSLFGGFSEETFTAVGGNTLALPLENPRGSVESLTLQAAHTWLLDEETQQGVTVAATFARQGFFRASELSRLRSGPAGIRGENVNYVNLNYDLWELDVDYDLTEDLTLHGGYANLHYSGHYDPAGIYSNYAQASGLTRFNNLDITQHQPFVGFDWELQSNVTWSVDARFFGLTDNLRAPVFATPAVPSLNLAFNPQLTTHPFSWDGYRLGSTLAIRF